MFYANPTSLDVAANAVIEDAIDRIKFWVSEGVTQSQAIQIVKSESCLGPKAWEYIQTRL